MPGTLKDLLTLFIESFLAFCPNVRNDLETLTSFKEYATYWENHQCIHFYLAELEWEDFETVSLSLKDYGDEHVLIVTNVFIKQFEQIVEIKLTWNALSILQRKSD